MRLFTLLTCALLVTSLMADSGGPDTYGYIWKDSNEPGGPVYNWIDITTTGMQVSGLADDNVVGPFSLTVGFPYYWYQTGSFWIGSNGYISFQNTNIASPFPLIPQAGGGNDFIAGLMSDLNFAGANNPAECWMFDNGAELIISYINVPFWSPTAPGGFDGSNTFQFILDRADSTITLQYQNMTGTTQNNDVTIGIESVTGDIGLMHSNDSIPVNNYAIRFYNPSSPLLSVTDATCNWLTDDANVGHMRGLGAAPFDMVLNVLNTGNQPINNFELVGEVVNPAFVQVVSDTQAVSALQAGLDTTVTFGNQFNASTVGTYRFIGRVNNVANELILTNNILEQELIVVDTTAAIINLNWAGPSDDGVGLGWNGGNGGIGVYIDVPVHPAYVSATTIRVASNTGAGMHMKVYDDDGPNGGPGTLLDSVFVDAVSATPGDHIIPLANPFILMDGGLYVEWQMDAAGINIGRDIVSPYSRRTFEILGGVWADYRDRETEDFHLGLQITEEPVTDGGCTSFFGVSGGSTVGQSTVIRTWVRNYGNQPLSGFDVSYQFDVQPVVAQPFGGTLSPGDSILFSFNQTLDPTLDANGDLCTWTNIAADADAGNDTTCINITLATSIAELERTTWEVGPVPSEAEVFITPNRDVSYTYELYDLTGALVRGVAEPLTGPIVLHLGQEQAGVYLLNIRSSDAVLTKRLVRY